MKKIVLSLSVLAVVMSCKNKEHGNKDILPQDEMTDVWNTTDGTEQHVFDDEASHEVHADATAEKDSLDAQGNYVYNVGELIQLHLPDSVTLEVGKNSTENKLFTLLSDANYNPEADKTKGWITLDRVYFNTGRAELTPTSRKQIENIAAIMKAYPSLELKVGGYTDNTGSQEVNQKVSLERAQSVANSLGKLGVQADRMNAEGYGQEHPICPANDTDACKAKNRRVDIRIAKK